MLMAAGATTAAGAAETATPQPRLVRAAHEFEAQMMKELLKPMSASNELTGEDEDSGGGAGAGGALGEFASEALGRALSEQGGLGIANQILRDLAPSGNRKGNGPVTGNLHIDTVMRALK
jgi:Rod binding domain-containing protein